MTQVIRKAMEVGFDKRQKPSNFLSNLFKTELLDGIKVEVQGRVVKGYYSVDTQLGTGGRYHSLDAYKTTDYTVPEYNDIGALTEEDVFKAQLGQTEYDVAANMVKKINDGQEIFSDQQRRAEEKQAADALFTGSVTLAGGNKIDYNKKGSHAISVSSAPWNSTGNPIAVLSNAIKLCVDDGKIGASEFNVVFEDAGLNAFLANSNVKGNSNWNEGYKRTDITMPEELTKGAFFHGRISIGSYIANIWSYGEKYTVPTGHGFAYEGQEFTYIPQGCALVLPMNPNFKKYFGAINNITAPDLSGIGGNKLQLVKREQLAYAYDEVKDGSVVTKYGVKSRPLLVPVDIDSFATIHGILG